MEKVTVFSAIAWSVFYISLWIKEYLDFKRNYNSRLVKCTDCFYFRLDDENIPYCLYENKCDIENPEDQFNVEFRPYFTKINK